MNSLLIYPVIHSLVLWLVSAAKLRRPLGLHELKLLVCGRSVRYSAKLKHQLGPLSTSQHWEKNEKEVELEMSRLTELPYGIQIHDELLSSCNTG